MDTTRDKNRTHHRTHPGKTSTGASGDLSFSPITEGLGFHPFSDGLPYAPVARTRPSFGMGTGAVSAGQPSFSPAITRPARVSVPIASKPAIAEPAAAPAVHAARAARAETRYGFVYVLKRCLAYLLDSALNVAICAAALSTVLVRQDLDPDALLSSSVITLFAVFLAFFNWALITAQEVAFGTTVGKRIFGLAIQGSASAVFLRSFFFLPSIGFAGLGLAWALFNRRRRCWHDVVVDLQPTEVARLR